MLGFTINPLIFIYMRLISSFVLFIVLLFSIPYGYLVSPIVVVLYYIFVEIIIIDLSIKVIVRELEEDALEFIPVFMLSIKGGRNIKKSLIYSTDIVDNTLSSEFKRVLFDEKVGKSFDESLIELKKRIPSDAINNAVLNITQSNIFGSSIINSLYNQIDFLREKQIQDIKTEIVKLPTKISAISVVFFVPIMLLLILAPVVLNYILG